MRKPKRKIPKKRALRRDVAGQFREDNRTTAAAKDRAELIHAAGWAPEKGVRYNISTAEFRRMVARMVGRDPTRARTPRGIARHILTEFKQRELSPNQIVSDYGVAYSQARKIHEFATLPSFVQAKYRESEIVKVLEKAQQDRDYPPYPRGKKKLEKTLQRRQEAGIRKGRRDYSARQERDSFGAQWNRFTDDVSKTAKSAATKVKRALNGKPKASRPKRKGARRDAAPSGLKVCPVGTQTQSLVLSKQFFTLKQAENWIQRHGFTLRKIEESRNNWRFRQHDPKRFEDESFRTIRLRPGVEAVIGCPLN